MASAGLLIGLLAGYGVVPMDTEWFVWVVAGIALWVPAIVRRGMPRPVLSGALIGLLAGIVAGLVKVVFLAAYLRSATEGFLNATKDVSDAQLRQILVLNGALYGLMFGLLVGLAALLWVRMRPKPPSPASGSPASSPVEGEGPVEGRMAAAGAIGPAVALAASDEEE